MRFLKKSITKERQVLSVEERNQMIEKYLPLIKKIAGFVIRNHTHQLDYDDLVNVGVFGLMQAIKNYKRKYHVNFAAYCKKRVRGAMLDELRRLDWLPRHARRQIKDIEEAKQDFYQRFSRPPDPQELANKLNISPGDLKTAPHKILSLSQITNQNKNSSEFYKILEDPKTQKKQPKEGKDPLGKFIKGLTKTEQLILILYYCESLNMHQIGLLLGVSESRICQIHKQIIKQLQARYYRK